jgi:hypothetical protein
VLQRPPPDDALKIVMRAGVREEGRSIKYVPSVDISGLQAGSLPFTPGYDTSLKLEIDSQRTGSLDGRRGAKLRLIDFHEPFLAMKDHGK